MGKRHNEDDFNPHTQASDYNAKARRDQVMREVRDSNDYGADNGYTRAARDIQLDANR